MNEQIEQAEWVLVVCTDEYKRRFDGNTPAGSGRGVRWESQHITQALYDEKFSNRRFVPLLPPGGDEACIPFVLKDYRNFRLDEEYEALYRLLTDQPATPAPDLGEIRHLPPLPPPCRRSPPNRQRSRRRHAWRLPIPTPDSPLSVPKNPASSSAAKRTPRASSNVSNSRASSASSAAREPASRRWSPPASSPRWRNERGG
jgi:hypothetical protein